MTRHYVRFTDGAFSDVGRSCSVSVPSLDHMGELLSLGRYKGDCALNNSSPNVSITLAHALRIVGRKVQTYRCAGGGAIMPPSLSSE